MKVQRAKEILEMPKTYEPPASDVTAFTFRFLLLQRRRIGY